MSTSRFNQILILLFFSLTLTTCIEPFTPPRTEYDDLLVVDGFISNDTTSYSVKLTRTYPIDTVQYKPETNATVTIVDDQDRNILLSEKSPGVYKTDSTSFIGEVDRAYLLLIHTQGGKDYKSDLVTMHKTPPIDSVHYEFTEIAANIESGKESGVQIYVDTHDPDNGTTYYRWDFEETWEILAELPSYYEYNGNEIVPRTNNITYCWKTRPSTQILIATSKNLTSDRISYFPLTFVSVGSRKLRTKYSILVRQYALSDDAYLFWENIKKNNESLGSLFDPQPGTVTGNVHNVSDPNEPVLGYFDAASISKVRIFIKRGELPNFIMPNPYNYCASREVPTDSVQFYLNFNYNPLDVWYGMFGPQGYYMASISCSDCRLQGSNQKPAFWK